MYWPLFAGLILRISLPWILHGFRSMDEHWQVIEPAQFLLNGDWFRAAEWEQGLRSWIYPGLVSLVLQTAEKLGIQEPIYIVSFVRSLHGLISSLAIPMVYFGVLRLSRSSKTDSNLTPKYLATAAAWFTAIWPYSIYCGFHTHGAFIGALFILCALTAPVFIRTHGYMAAGGFFGVALALKIDLAIAGLGFGLWQLIHRRFDRALELVLGVSPFVFLVGFADRLTWGSWFYSVIGHARVNLLEHIGNQWGVSPWYTHILFYFDVVGVTALVSMFVLAWAWNRLPENLRAAWFTNGFFIFIFCLIDHKEKRFLAPLMYTGQAAAFATLSYFKPLPQNLRAYFRQKSSKRILAVVVCVALIGHWIGSFTTYLVKQPWWDRIHALQNAGRIPNIERVLSPHWPLAFYLPRHVPSYLTGADLKSLWVATRGIHRFGIATDQKGLHILGDLGFECSPWPEPPSTSNLVPWAYACEAKTSL